MPEKRRIPVLENAVEFSASGMQMPSFRFDADHAREFFSGILEAQESDRIDLKALTSCEGKKLLFVLSVAPGTFVHIEVDCSKLAAVPSLREIWPVASWWEDELQRTGEISFSSEFKIEGVKWPQ